MNGDPTQELANPDTSAARLQELAAAHPELGQQISAHPNCYPQLRDWIAQYGDPEAPADPAPGRTPRRGWKGLGIAAAIALPLVSAAGITIPLMSQLSERQTSLDTLTITPDETTNSAEVIGQANDPSAQGEIDWEIPVSAPIESFPLDNTPSPDGTFAYCSEAQLDWLRTHAQPGTGEGSRVFTLTLHNSSTTGGALPLGNLRFVGGEVASEPLVRFMCPSGGRGAAGGGQPLLIKVTGEESTYGEAVGVTGDEVMPEGSPVTLNLAPGEVNVVTLTRDPSVETQRRYQGEFVADLIDGSGTSVTLAEDVAFRRAAVPGFFVGFPSGELSAQFVCLSPSYSGESSSSGATGSRPCTLAQAAKILAEAKTHG